MSDDINIRKMESGEVELRKAFEDVTKMNVQAIVDYSKDTRNLLRNTQDEVKHLKNMLIKKDTEFVQLQKQIATLQQKLYAQGS